MEGGVSTQGGVGQQQHPQGSSHAAVKERVIPSPHPAACSARAWPPIGSGPCTCGGAPCAQLEGTEPLKYPGPSNAPIHRCIRHQLTLYSVTMHSLVSSHRHKQTKLYLASEAIHQSVSKPHLVLSGVAVLGVQQHLEHLGAVQPGGRTGVFGDACEHQSMGAVAGEGGGCTLSTLGAVQPVTQVRGASDQAEGPAAA